MKTHTGQTAQILSRVSCFAPLAADAAAHHERLDGRGYHRGPSGAQISLATRILAVSDICDALRSSRPYREGLPAARVMEIGGRDAPVGLDAEVVEALRSVLMASTTAEPFAVPAARIVDALQEDYRQAA